MLQLKSIVILCLVIFLPANNQIAVAQQSIKKVVRVGIEYGNYLSSNSGTFSKSPGITFGYLTGINIYSDSSSSILLGVGINYTKQLFYRAKVNYETNAFYKYRYVYDERYRLAFTQLGLYPEYYYSVNDNIIVGVYLGSSIGIGSEWLESNFINRTIIDSTKNYGETLYGVNGEYNMGNWRLPISYHIGVSFYYKRLMFDFRFTYSDMNSKQDFLNGLNNGFIQIGFVL